MYKVYLSPSTNDKSFGVNNFGTEEFRMNQIMDSVERNLLQTGEYAVYRNAYGMTIDEIIRDSNELKPNVHIVIKSSGNLNKGVNCYVKVGDNISNGIGKEVYKQVTNIYYNKNIDNGLTYDKDMLEIHKVNSPAITIEVGNRNSVEDVKWIISNIENIGKAISKGIENGLGLKFC